MCVCGGGGGGGRGELGLLKAIIIIVIRGNTSLKFSVAKLAQK